MSCIPEEGAVTQSGQFLPTTTISFDWSQGGPAVIPADNLHPGLYSATLISRSSLRQERSDAWILIANSPQFEELSTSFEEEIISSQKWDKNVPEDAARSFLRACLEDLAGEAVR